mmetsp:Transcript_19628/g.52955  ORF Transcript_19628/g.52955 Transcript_19628/m.52955 type:complete len:236 (+) Transcript_19628:2442-3149(+)
MLGDGLLAHGLLVEDEVATEAVVAELLLEDLAPVALFGQLPVAPRVHLGAAWEGAPIDEGAAAAEAVLGEEAVALLTLLLVRLLALEEVLENGVWRRAPCVLAGIGVLLHLILALLVLQAAELVPASIEKCALDAHNVRHMLLREHVLVVTQVLVHDGERVHALRSDQLAPVGIVRVVLVVLVVLIITWHEPVCNHFAEGGVLEGQGISLDPILTKANGIERVFGGGNDSEDARG